MGFFISRVDINIMLDPSFDETPTQSTANSSQPYLVLARRTRPQSFGELIGQGVVTKTLGTMLANQKIPHAFLFTGTRGTGKTSSARILAKSLCCENGPTLTPCQTCRQCVQITACAHEDVLEIDGASNTGVDQIRELRESARFYPNSARYRIFVIDEVHMLSVGAFNALLKVLEEPPPQVVFILATTEYQKVPVTVRSRCMTLPFRKVETEVIAAHLKNILTGEKIETDDASLMLIARSAKGSIRDSLSLTEQVVALSGGKQLNEPSTREALGLVGQELAFKLCEAIGNKQQTQALSILLEADTANLDLSLVVEETAQLFKNALIVKDIKDVEKARRLTDLLPREIEQLVTLTKDLSRSALSELYRLLTTAAREVVRNTEALSWMQIAVLDAIARADWLSADELMTAFGPYKAASQTISPSAAPRSPSPSTPAANVYQPAASGYQPQTVSAKNVPSDDLSKFAGVIAIIEKQNIALAAKLKNATLETFTPALIQFKDSDANKLFTQLSVQDAQLFLGALKQCGFAGAKIKGIELPKDVSGASAKANLEPPPVSPRIKASTQLSKVQDIDVFGDSDVSSVASLERSHKKAALKEKEHNIKNTESVKKLSEFATSIEIEPFDPAE